MEQAAHFQRQPHTVLLEDGLSNSHELDNDGIPKRTGNFWTASAHIITAVIGSGVLSLAWSMAQLGWIAGPIALIGFAIITFYTSILLADCYRSSDPTSKRNYTYMDAVRSNLGELQTKLCAVVQYTNFVGVAIGYSITTSLSMVAIMRSNCFHSHGHQAHCYFSNNLHTLLFGALQIVLSQIPSFSKLWWISIVAAVMSFSYSTIGVGLSIGKIVADRQFQGTLHGLLAGPKVESIWPSFQALGNIAFAYSYSMILIEIQDTLKSPPDESHTMKKANLMGVSVTTIFYVLCGCTGYAAFGQNSPGNLLTGFGLYEPYWLVDFANACVVVHLVGAYQVYCQPLFAFVEEWASTSFPKNLLLQVDYNIRIPFHRSGTFQFNIFRVLWRSMFVIFTTLMSMLIPFFNDILGVLGALGFWPLTVYFPIEMHISQTKTPKWSLKWCFLQGLSIFCLLISLAALIGSIQGVIADLKTYKPFHAQ